MPPRESAGYSVHPCGKSKVTSVVGRGGGTLQDLEMQMRKNSESNSFLTGGSSTITLEKNIWLDLFFARLRGELRSSPLQKNIGFNYNDYAVPGNLPSFTSYGLILSVAVMCVCVRCSAQIILSGRKCSGQGMWRSHCLLRSSEQQSRLVWSSSRADTSLSILEKLLKTHLHW